MANEYREIGWTASWSLHMCELCCAVVPMEYVARHDAWHASLDKPHPNHPSEEDEHDRRDNDNLAQQRGHFDSGTR